MKRTAPFEAAAAVSTGRPGDRLHTQTAPTSHFIYYIYATVSAGNILSNCLIAFLKKVFHNNNFMVHCRV
jgi:hypothetical protein